MRFEWREFLELARDIQNYSGPGYSREAAWRTAVSRAYYAAFCHARNYAEANLGFQPNRDWTDHRGLREHFQKLGQPWINIAARLQRIRRWRNDCDYSDVVPDLPNLVKFAIKEAEDVIAQLK